MRAFFLHHVTWSINSVCHYFGSRRFEIEDRSTNVFWLAIPSMGESWHHNHHAFPRSAAHGLGRREIDVSAGVIRVLEKARARLERRADRARAPGREADRREPAPAPAPVPPSSRASPRASPSSGSLDRPAAHAAGRLALGALADRGRQAAEDQLEVGDRQPPDLEERLGHAAGAVGESSMPSSARTGSSALTGSCGNTSVAARKRPAATRSVSASKSTTFAAAHQQEHARRADPLELRAAEEALVVGRRRREHEDHA